MIEYRKGDLFENAPKGAILAHACNCKGVWGSGIAKQFAERFPYSHNVYRNHCDAAKRYNLTIAGSTLIVESEVIVDEIQEYQKIACMLTSYDYGKNKDDVNTIFLNTMTAAMHLFTQLDHNKPYAIHSPKINAGLFGVPWELTEKAINHALEKGLVENSYQPPKNIKWIVWDL